MTPLSNSSDLSRIQFDLVSSLIGSTIASALSLVKLEVRILVKLEVRILVKLEVRILVKLEVRILVKLEVRILVKLEVRILVKTEDCILAQAYRAAWARLCQGEPTLDARANGH